MGADYTPALGTGDDWDIVLAFEKLPKDEDWARRTCDYTAANVTDGGEKNLGDPEEKQSTFLGVRNEGLTSKLEGC